MSVKTAVLPQQSEDALRRAVEVLEGGGLVAFPTDTVYGLGALPWDAEAVRGLYRAKRRPPDRPIPLLLSDPGQVSRIAVPTGPFAKLSAHFWPGGLTLVLPKAARVPAAVSARPTVAVRVPDLPLARRLIRQAGGVLAVTSANISGQPSPTTAEEVEAQLGGRIALILDGGPCPGGVASTIVDLTTSPPALVRRGAIREADLRAAVGSIGIP